MNHEGDGGLHRAHQVILFNMCGHGHFDMAAWSKFNSGELVDHEYILVIPNTML